MIDQSLDKYSTHNWDVSPESLKELADEMSRANAKRLQAKSKYQWIHNRKDATLAKIAIRVRNGLLDKGHRKPTILQIDGACADDKDFIEFHEGYHAAQDKMEESDAAYWDLRTKWETCRSILAERRNERGGSIREAW